MQGTTGEILKCQNCHLPLQIDSSLLDLSLSQRNRLTYNTISNGTDSTGNRKYHISKDRVEQSSKVQSIEKINSELKLPNAAVVDSYVYLRKDPYLKNDKSSLQKKIENSDMDENKRENDNEIDEREQESSTNEFTTVKTLSNQVNTLTNVFNILSSKSTIDYPVCQDCCNILISKLKNEYNSALEQRDIYRDFLDKLESQNIIENSKDNSNDENNEKLINKEADDLQIEKEQLLEELIKMENENEELDKDILELQQKLDNQKKIHNDTLIEENIAALNNIEFLKEMQLLENQYNFALNSLDQLRKTNIYNETFRISHDGPFGTINNLRLGSYSERPVSWNEINAAIGQIVLLLATITTRLKVKIKGYKLQPLGSFSKISKFENELQDWVLYEAYNDENFKFSKLFRKETNFDKALVSIIDIIKQITTAIVNPASTQDTSTSTGIELDPVDSINAGLNSNTGQVLPYDMINGNINGISLKLYGAEPNLQWTTGMKFLLTNVKWLLVYSSSRLKSLASDP